MATHRAEEDGDGPLKARTSLQSTVLDSALSYSTTERMPSLVSFSRLSKKLIFRRKLSRMSRSSALLSSGSFVSAYRSRRDLRSRCSLITSVVLARASRVICSSTDSRRRLGAGAACSRVGDSALAERARAASVTEPRRGSTDARRPPVSSRLRRRDTEPRRSEDPGGSPAEDPPLRRGSPADEPTLRRGSSSGLVGGGEHADARDARRDDADRSGSGAAAAGGGSAPLILGEESDALAVAIRETATDGEVQRAEARRAR